ncbi:aldehyde dehydrogenase family protein, partial [Phytoactinopolyspora endophytica]|uniref:aldehyde dehydrogenase family protein n=1 Tax=Phytoactinopolyspora endophytica TaxID=1642495 RepID=UPI00197C8E50
MSTHTSASVVTSVVDGKPVDGTRTVTGRNPARYDDVVAEISFADAATVVDAAASAKRAQPAWASVPAPIRGRAIAHIGRLVEANMNELAALVTRDVGKP